MARLFGTDGVRGIANEELTPLLAMQLGQAGAYVLTKEKEHKPTIMVGCDTRISGDMLANALMAGACSVGANCVYVGVIPTPAVAFLTQKYKVDAGVVISASHNPVEFNGIKFFDGDGYKLPDALEDEIESLINSQMQGVKFPIGPGVGKIKYRTDAREEYINHAIQSVPVALEGMKIVVDCAEGAAYYTSVEALKELGASVVAIHNNPDGTNINANCGSTHMAELQARVVYEKARIGLAFDGDAVLFADEAERIFKEKGLNAFEENERMHAREPLAEGPFARFLKKLSDLQRELGTENCPIRTALVTSRSAPAHERVIRTMRSWNVRVDEAFFLGGLEKKDVLRAFGAQIFFDDQPVHISCAAQSVPAARVPYGRRGNISRRAI